MIKTLLGLSLKGGDKSRLSIIDYHRITPVKDPFVDSATQSELDWQCSILNKYFNVLPLGQAIELLQKGQLPPRSVVITFDDGYANNYTLALPILIKWDMPATFFIASGYLDGGIMWNDSIIESLRRTEYESIELLHSDGYPAELVGIYDLSTQNKKIAAATKLRLGIKYLDLAHRAEQVEKLLEITGVTPPEDIMLTSEQVKEMSLAGMDIGGHTLSHPILTTLSLEQAKEQICKDKDNLQQIVGEHISHFAYPNGKPEKDFIDAHIKILKEAGYSGAVTTQRGVAQPNGDIYKLPRFSSWDKTTLRYLYRMFINGFGVYG